jgi:hypothetical protein
MADLSGGAGGAGGGAEHSWRWPDKLVRPAPVIRVRGKPLLPGGGRYGGLARRVPVVRFVVDFHLVFEVLVLF